MCNQNGLVQNAAALEECYSVAASNGSLSESERANEKEKNKKVSVYLVKSLDSLTGFHGDICYLSPFEQT